MSSSKDIKKFIDKQNSLNTLKFITCGSVDDGKSTLLGRLLYEAQLVFDDQVDSLVSDSKKIGTQGGNIDFALLVDGLAAEREQGITIDVAYRFFSTDLRKFIVADSPGHEQYTRNMVTAASNAELAIILIDARKGVLEQTKRHSFIADMVGIKNIIVAVNKMDLIDYDENKFKKIIEDYNLSVASHLNFSEITFIPISALNGDNITTNSSNMKWHTSPPIMKLLEKSKIKKGKNNSFCMHVQNVLRPNLDFRGFCGRVSAGNLNIGDKIFVGQSNKSAKIKSILIGDEAAENCSEGDSITFTLDREIDISRGDLIAKDISTIEKEKMFDANVIWLNDNKCYKNRNLLIKIGTRTLNASMVKFKHKIDVNSYAKITCNFLEMNDIAKCEIKLDDDVEFRSYKEARSLGSFILVDKQSNLTVAAGTINNALRKSSNVIWENLDVSMEARNEMLGHKSKVLWFTGLSGSGKSTLSNLIEKELHSKNILSYALDGDNLRHGLNRDLNFSDDDRSENIRRIGEVAKLLTDAGVLTIAAFVSPFKKDRDMVKNIVGSDNFIEIYVNASLAECEKRDTKGLYKKAREGEIKNMTGISSSYEAPANPALEINTDKESINESMKRIKGFIINKLEYGKLYN